MAGCSRVSVPSLIWRLLSRERPNPNLAGACPRLTRPNPHTPIWQVLSPYSVNPQCPNMAGALAAQARRGGHRGAQSAPQGAAQPAPICRGGRVAR
eukprot:6194386-Prymnesium_polylepis.2